MYSTPGGGGTGTLAVRSASMEHYRSVFATTAVMVFGLVAASPLLKAQDTARPQPRAILAAASTAESSREEVWIDPPRSLVKMAAVRDEGDGAPLPKPASFTLLPPETVALLAAGEMGAKADAAPRAQAVRRHRATRVAHRSNPPATTEAPSTEAPASVQEAAAVEPQKAARIDPIGDILRGLGIGRDS